MLVTKHVLLASTVHATPYFIVRGMMPGPVMFITSGVHGNANGEYGRCAKTRR